MTASADAAKRRGRVFLCGFLPVIATAILSIYKPAFFPRLDDSIYDTVMRSGSIDPPGKRVVIVDIDERSLTTMGQWPWRRDVIGRLITRLRDMGAAVIGMDIIFAETDRLEIREEGLAQASPDQLLADVLRQGKVILGSAVGMGPAGRDRTDCVVRPSPVAVVHPRGEKDQLPFFQTP